MAMSPRRNGFTLIELLIAMILVAILATIGMNRFWSVKDKGLVAAMRNDLRNVASLQEEYFQKHYNYTLATSDLVDFVPTPGVTVTLTYAAIDGWSGTASHNSLPPTTQCGYFTGNAAIQAPATRNGVIGCIEP
jgi:prepilin-type N-terminal cleavage/methylation domain-containing protein